MLNKFQNILNTKFPVLKSGKLFLAISGGKDSMTLSHLLKASGLDHTLLHCNFQLRGSESDNDENFIRNYAQANNLKIHVQKFDTATIAEQKKLTIQECARNLRYEWFRSFLTDDETTFLLTAHHLDDSIETFFINLFRGTGYRGLAGIPPITANIIRPISEFTSDEIFKYIDQHHIDYRTDSSNAKKDYLRNKIRHDLIPTLVEFEPDIRIKMSALFTEMNELKLFVDSEINGFKAKHKQVNSAEIVYSLVILKTMSNFFREQLFNEYGIHRKNSAEFSKFLEAPSGSKFYAASFEFLIDRERLIIRPADIEILRQNRRVGNLPDSFKYAGKIISLRKSDQVDIIKNNSSLQQLDLDKIKFPLTVRNWQQGDKIQPLGLNGMKLISDILIDKKISLTEKENQLVITDATGQILCLVGLTVSDLHKIKADTLTVLEINLDR